MFFYETALIGSPTYIKLSSWIDSEILNIDWGFLFDSLTVIMCCVITFVSPLVHIYSTEYMAHDPHLARFMSYIYRCLIFTLLEAVEYVQALFIITDSGFGSCFYIAYSFFFNTVVYKNTI